jgi:hypothetical protein
MQLIDEQDDVLARPDLLEDLLQPFEVTPVPRVGHQRAQVQGVELLVLDGQAQVLGLQRHRRAQRTLGVIS